VGRPDEYQGKKNLRFGNCIKKRVQQLHPFPLVLTTKFLFYHYPFGIGVAFINYPYKIGANRQAAQVNAQLGHLSGCGNYSLA
jgi:hypothetical protein